MDISFIIPVFNQLSFTQTCIATLQATLPRDLSYEIIIVDNASSDGTPAWSSTLRSPVRVLRNEQNLGYGPACNRAAASAIGRFLAILNNDLVFLPGWLEPMLDLLGRSNRTIVGNIQLSVRTRTIDHAGVLFDADGQPHHFRASFDVLTGPAALRVPAITGACMLLHADAFRALGGFDEHYVNGYEDMDLCLRARQAGADILVATRSLIFHYVGSSDGRHLRESANASRFAAKWRNIARTLASTAPSSPFDSTPPSPASRFDPTDYTTLQVFHPSPAGYSEITSTTHLYRTRRWSRVRFAVTHLELAGIPLRIDPCNDRGVIRLASLRVLPDAGHPPLFIASGADECARVFSSAGTAKIHGENPRWLTLASNGDDPQLQLRTSSLPPAFQASRTLLVELCLRFDPGKSFMERCAVDNASALS